MEKLKKTITDSISMPDFVKVLYRISELMKDGHSQPFIVQPAFIEDLRKDLFFPYALVSDKSKLFVPQSSATASGLPVGAEVVAINGIKTGTLLNECHMYIGGNNSYTEEMSGRLLAYFLYLSGIRPPFHMEYLDMGAEKKEKEIEKGLNFMNALAVTMPHLKAKYNFRIMDNKLGYINFMSMSDDINNVNSFFDSCFTAFKNNNIRSVAIDIRQNSGGNSILGDLLFSYINTKRYTLMGGRKWKVSARYKEYLSSNGDTASDYLKRENGSIWALGNCEPQENRFRNDSVFSGKVYLLTGPFTFSSANMIADGAKQFKVAELVGEPTGENTNDFGEAYTFLLPASKIKMQTTTSFDYGANCNRSDHQPVMPDKLIESTREDKIYEKDRVLEYLLKSIK